MYARSFISNCLLAMTCGTFDAAKVNINLTLPAALYVYERSLVFGQEVELVWQRKVTFPTIVYAVMHLSTVTSLCTSVALLAVTSCEVSCSLKNILGISNFVDRGMIFFRIA